MTTKTTQQDASKAYKAKQAEIEKLMQQITAGLDEHKRDAYNQGNLHWGHVGDLASIAETLTDLRDRLLGMGEYA